jgi:hypothetical protein
VYERLLKAAGEMAAAIAEIEEHSGAMLAESEGLEHRQYSTLHTQASRAYESVYGIAEELGREFKAAENYRVR